MKLDIISFVGLGSAVRAMVDYFRFWQHQTALKSIELRQAEASALDVELSNARKEAEIAEARIRNAQQLIQLARDAGAIPSDHNPTLEEIAAALAILEKHFSNGTLQRIRLIDPTSGKLQVELNIDLSDRPKSAG